MRSLEYNLELSLLDDAIQKFLDKRGIGAYKDEAHLRTSLAKHLKDFEVEEEIDFTSSKGKTYRADIVVYIEKRRIPIELKYNNDSIDEYEEDEDKCRWYINNFEDINDAYCIFISNIDHKEYGYWITCKGNMKFHYMWKKFPSVDDGLYL